MYGLFLECQSCQNSNYTANRSHSGEDCNDFFFAPAAHFVVMMDRTHFEDTFAGALEADDLQNNGHGFHDVDNADKQQQYREAYAECQCAHYTTKEQRAGITHENFCRVEVPAEEAQTAAGKSACKQVHFGDAEDGSYDHHTDSCHKGNGRTETIDTVSQVYCVDGADDNKHCKWIVQQTNIKLTKERDLQDGGGCSTEVQNCQIERCDQQLACHFLFCSQTEVLFFLPLSHSHQQNPERQKQLP